MMRRQESLQGKVAIVTGASSGIGEAAARLFARAGAWLALAARRRQRLERLADEIGREGGVALSVPTDLTDRAQISALVQTTLARYGRIDILANIAGWGRYNWIEEMSAEDLRRQYEVNVIGMAELIRQVVPAMKSQKSGVILNISSYASEIAVPPLTIYASTKYAVEGLSDGLRRELRPWGIAVVRIHPSAVSGTEFNVQASREGGIFIPNPPVAKIARERLAAELVSLAVYPRRAFYISRLYDVPVLINRFFPTFIDWVSAWWVRRQRREELHAFGRTLPARYETSFSFWQIAAGLAILALIAGLWWAMST